MIDLHAHSNYSDGTADPVELIQLAQASGVTGLAITDHDNIAAYSIAAPAAKQLGIELITGVELSSVLQGHSVHVLGYAFCPHSDVLEEKCRWYQEQRRVRNCKMLELLAAKKMVVEESDLGGIGTIGRPHIAMAMIAKGYVKTIQEAFAKYLGEHKSCYVAGERWSAEEAIAIIHAAKGKAVIAHPHVIRKQSIIRKLLALPFDGIEVYYGNFDAHTNQRWLQVAQEKGWLATGGSDFHGDVKPDVRLASATCPVTDFEVLKAHFYANL